jgi:shikimate kinase
MHNRIFLIGFMGSGKSTMGFRLARKMGYTFVDMDHLIEETAEMSIPEIFREHGENIFRKWEHDILLELCEKDQIIISTGGGAPCHGDMMDIMNANGTTVYLKLSPSALKDRLVKSKTQRPLIAGKNEEELLAFIQSKLAEREAHYSRAQYTADGINLSLDCLTKILNIS